VSLIRQRHGWLLWMDGRIPGEGGRLGQRPGHRLHHRISLRLTLLHRLRPGCATATGSGAWRLTR